jgi:hypothetical protein
MNFQSAWGYFAAGQGGNRARLVQMQRELQDLRDDLISLGGKGIHMDGAYDKIFCKIHDPQFPLRLLPPYSGFTEEFFEDFVQLVRRKYPRWVK